MRIWSIHPKYLDTKGLVALWRETLLAKHVLEGRTKGYRNHPQLERFKNAEKPLDAINQYLAVVYEEAVDRGYNFVRDKINWSFEPLKMVTTTGQIKFEVQHLLNKLKQRDEAKYSVIIKLKTFDPHPIFETLPGGIERWEKI